MDKKSHGPGKCEALTTPFDGSSDFVAGFVHIHEIFKKIEFYLRDIQNEIATENPPSSEIIYLQSALIIKQISRNIKDNN